MADCLRAHGVVFLRSKASGYGIKFAGNLKKDELVARFSEVALSSPDELFGHLIPMPNAAYDAFCDACRSGFALCKRYLPHGVVQSCFRDFPYAQLQHDGTVLCVADEVRAIWKRNCKVWMQVREYWDMIENMARAAANLWGEIPFDELATLPKHFGESPCPANSLRDVLKYRMSFGCDLYATTDTHLVAADIMDGKTAFSLDALVEKHRKHPRFVPDTMGEFLRYANPKYFAMTTAAGAAGKFLLDKCGRDDAACALADLYERLQKGELPEAAAVAVAAKFCPRRSLRNEFADLLAVAADTLRLREFNGNQPCAIADSQGGESAKKTTDAASQIDFSHVGRNDPCPCGSGKKFKKCCGR